MTPQQIDEQIADYLKRASSCYKEMVDNREIYASDLTNIVKLAKMIQAETHHQEEK